MVNKARRKGTVGENGVRDYLRAHGFPMAERLAGQGSLDRGDLTGIHPSVIVEVKNCVKATLAGWLKEVAVEKLNAKALIGAVWFKKAGTTDAGQWYVVQTGEDYTKMLNVWVASQVASTVGPGAVPLGGDDPSLGAAQWEHQLPSTPVPRRRSSGSSQPPTRKPLRRPSPTLSTTVGPRPSVRSEPGRSTRQ